MRKHSVMAAVASVAVALVGVTTTSAAATSTAVASPKSRPAASSRLVYAEEVPPDTLNPQGSANAVDTYAWELSYQCLLTQSPGGAIEPLLATSYKVNRAGTVYTFELRRGVEFQNGKPFNSTDVVFTFDRLLKYGIPYDQSLFSTLKKVSGVGGYEVRFSLSSPDPNFIPNMANPTDIGCSILEANSGANLDQKMIGTGPYKMTSYQPNNEMTLTRFTHYWGPAPKNSGIEVIYVPNPLTAEADLQSGKVDLIFPPSTEVAQLKDDSNLKVQRLLTADVDQLCIDSLLPPFNNVLVRRAVAEAIDRQQIAELVYGGAAVPSSYFPPGVDKWAPQLSSMPYSSTNVAQAKKLLAEAGYPNGFTTSLIYIAGYSPQSAEEAAVEKSQLAEIGITVNLLPLQSAAYASAFGSGGKPTYGLAWNFYDYFANPLQYLNARPNRQGPTPSALEKLFDEVPALHTTANYDKLVGAIARQEANLAFPNVPLVSPDGFVAYSKKLSGVHITSDFSRTVLAEVSVG